MPDPTPSRPLPLWPDAKSPENPTLTPFLLPPTTRPRAALIVLPGGAYRERVEHEKGNIARWVNSLGLHAFVCDYRVAPARHPAPLEDALRAIRLIRHHATEWQVDPERIGCLGFSAGGHLACSVGNFADDGDPHSTDPVARHSSRAGAVLAGYPLISAAWHRELPTYATLIGPDPDPELVHRLSLENTVTARNPPTFLWSTADDPLVAVENLLVYGMALRRQRVPFAMHIYPHGRHGLALAGEDAVVGDWTGRCANWLAALGWR